VEWYHVCWPRLTAKRVERVVSISWASCYRKSATLRGCMTDFLQTRLYVLPCRIWSFWPMHAPSQGWGLLYADTLWQTATKFRTLITINERKVITGSITHKNFVTRMLTRHLFAVANNVFRICETSKVVCRCPGEAVSVHYTNWPRHIGIIHRVFYNLKKQEPIIIIIINFWPTIPW